MFFNAAIAAMALGVSAQQISTEEQPRLVYLWQYDRVAVSEDMYQAFIACFAEEPDCQHMFELSEAGNLNAQFIVYSILRGREFNAAMGLPDYFDGIVEMSIEDAMAELIRLANNGQPQSQALIGSIFIDGPSPLYSPSVIVTQEQAFDYLVESTLSGSLTGNLRLADAYNRGNAVDVNQGLAIRLYERALNMGHPYAGISLVRNFPDLSPEDVTRYLIASAELGLAPAVEALCTGSLFNQSVEDRLMLTSEQNAYWCDVMDQALAEMMEQLQRREQ